MEVLFPGSSQTPRRFPLHFIELAAGTAARVGALTVTPYGVVHGSGAPAYALRVVCAGRVVTYSGDTGWTEVLLQAAQGADLFICEFTFFASQVKYHLDYQALLQHRAALGCRRLVLTHLGPEMLARLQDVVVEWAEDGKIIALPASP